MPELLSAPDGLFYVMPHQNGMNNGSLIHHYGHICKIKQELWFIVRLFALTVNHFTVLCEATY